MVSKATAHVVDFSNVKEAGAFNTGRIPAGDYLAKVTDVQDHKKEGDPTPQYVFTIKVVSHSQKAYPYYCKLQENQLWKLRNLFIAAGVPVPKKRIKVDPNKVVGKLIGVTMEDDEYNDKEKSVVSAVFPASELPETSHTSGKSDDDGDAGYEEDGEDEGDQWNTGGMDPDAAEDLAEETEEEADEEEEEADDTEEGDGLDEMDRTALKAHIRTLDAAFVVRKSMTDDDLRASARELSGANGPDEEEEEEDEPAPAPVAKKAPVRKAAAAKRAAEVTDDELDSLDIDDL